MTAPHDDAGHGWGVLALTAVLLAVWMVGMHRAGVFRALWTCGT